MEIVLRASVVFAVIFLLMRGLRRRSLAEMSPFEMILVVTLGDIIQQGVTQEDYSLTGALLAAGTFAFWIAVMTWGSWRSATVRRLLEGVPLVIVQDGQPVEEVMKVEQMPMDELLEAARQQGIDDLGTVRLAVLEPSGKISFIPKSGC